MYVYNEEQQHQSLEFFGEADSMVSEMSSPNFLGDNARKISTQYNVAILSSHISISDSTFTK